MCDHENHEAAMVVIRPSEPGRRNGIWCDPCLEPLVRALNDGGMATVASCCGHEHSPGWVMLADGRCVLLTPDRTWMDRLFDVIHAFTGCPPGRECSKCLARTVDAKSTWPEMADDLARLGTSGVYDAFWRCFEPDLGGVDWPDDKAILTFAREIAPVINRITALRKGEPA